MNTLESIAKILKEQVDGYMKLRELLQKENEALRAFDPEAVAEISKEKDTSLLRLRLLEEERLRLTRKFVRETPSIEGNVTMKRIVEVTGNTELDATRSKLVSLVQVVGELNSINKILIDRSLNYVRSASNFFDSIGVNKAPQLKGTLVSRSM